MEEYSKIKLLFLRPTGEWREVAISVQNGAFKAAALGLKDQDELIFKGAQFFSGENLKREISGEELRISAGLDNPAGNVTELMPPSYLSDKISTLAALVEAMYHAPNGALVKSHELEIRISVPTFFLGAGPSGDKSWMAARVRVNGNKIRAWFGFTTPFQQQNQLFQTTSLRVVTSGEAGSACERLMGIRQRDFFEAEWKKSVRGFGERLVLRRKFECTRLARDSWFWPLNPENPEQVHLEQWPRDLDEVRKAPALTSRQWFVSPYFDPISIELKRDEFKWRFANRWKVLMESFQGRMENQTTALFGLECTSAEGPVFDLARNSEGKFRIEPRPPFVNPDATYPVTYFGRALQDHQKKPLVLSGRLNSGLLRINAAEAGPYAIPVNPEWAILDDVGVATTATDYRAWKLAFTLSFEPSKTQKGYVRAGALDIRFGGQRMPSAAPATFIFQQTEVARFDCVSSLELSFFAIGWEKVSEAQSKNFPDQIKRLGAYWIPKGLSLPVAEVIPGECDHDPAEFELKTSTSGLQRAQQRPLLILGKAQKEKNQDAAAGEPILLLSEIAGHDFTREFVLRLKLTKTRPPQSDEVRQFLYLDRTPFFVGLFSIPSILDFDLQQGNEAAYLTSKGVFRGWQLRATAYEYELHLPPQGVGEAMEKGRAPEGYRDIEPGQPVEFRFPPPTTLKIGSSDLDRRYGNTPWNLRLTLNSMRETSQVGLPLHEAHLEMLYGLRFHIRNVPHLRIAELFTRLGFPRRPLSSLPAAREFLLDEKAVMAYEQKVSEWSRQLDVLDSRLAVYEVFDDRQVDFDQKGEPVGLALQGPPGSKQVSAELRKSAVLRTSLPGESATDSNEVGTRKPLAEIKR